MHAQALARIVGNFILLGYTDIAETLISFFQATELQVHHTMDIPSPTY